MSKAVDFSMATARRVLQGLYRRSTRPRAACEGQNSQTCPTALLPAQAPSRVRRDLQQVSRVQGGSAAFKVEAAKKGGGSRCRRSPLQADRQAALTPTPSILFHTGTGRSPSIEHLARSGNHDWKPPACMKRAHTSTRRAPLLAAHTICMHSLQVAARAPRLQPLTECACVSGQGRRALVFPPHRRTIARSPPCSVCACYSRFPGRCTVPNQKYSCKGAHVVT